MTAIGLPMVILAARIAYGTGGEASVKRNGDLVIGQVKLPEASIT